MFGLLWVFVCCCFSDECPRACVVCVCVCVCVCVSAVFVFSCVLTRCMFDVCCVSSEHVRLCVCVCVCVCV